MSFEPPQHVIDAYKESHRKYHNLDHIYDLLDKIHLFRQNYDIGNDIVYLLEIAAWYHDVVYVPGEKLNERRSAELFSSDVLRARLDPIYYGEWQWDDIDVMDVKWAITGTRDHKVPATWIAAILYDLDLSSLGSHFNTYAEKCIQIREEYAEFSDVEWLAGRIAFIEGMLERPFIYHTSLGYSLWEQEARNNMKMELYELKNL